MSFNNTSLYDISKNKNIFMYVYDCNNALIYKNNLYSELNGKINKIKIDTYVNGRYRICICLIDKQNCVNLSNDYIFDINDGIINTVSK